VSPAAAGDAGASPAEDLFLQLLHLSPVPMAITHLTTGELLEANDSFFSILGYTRDETIGKTTAELGVWKAPGDRKELIARLLASERRSVSFELPIRSRSGERLVDEISLSVIRWRGEDCLLAITRGTNEREAVVQLRRLRETQLRLFLDQLPAVIWTTDTSLIITSSGGAGLSALGLEPGALVGSSLAEYLEGHARDGNALNAHERALAGTPTSYDVQLGDVIYFAHVDPLRDGEGRITGCVGVALDVTEQRRAEAALRESEERYRRLVSLSFNSIVIVRDDKLLYVNDAGARLYGARDPQDLFGTPVLNLIHPDDRDAVAARLRAMHQGVPAPLREGRILRLDGEARSVEAAGLPILYGGESACLVVLRDITERKDAAERIHRHAEELESLVMQRTERIRDLERQRADVEKLALTGRMTSRIAHEINNPLAGIKYAFNLIKDTVPADHPYFGYVEGIDREIDRIARIVRQMIDVQREQPSPVHAFCLASLISDVATMVGAGFHEKRVRIESETTPDSAIVALPEDSLRQVLINLVKNAAEASRPDGRVRIGSVIEDQTIRISVHDEGVGIAASMRERVYEPFVTTKSGSGVEGVGLGLTISRGLIEAMGGAIDFVSEKGRGTIFIVTLPRNV
jgi:two-component system, sporulation sensor kinase C